MKVFLSFFLLYWALGMLIFPGGDFSALKDLPQQYEYCRETEDKDMTFLDFITDHLVNFDGLFDKHEEGDEQKPHKPVQYNQYNSVSYISQYYKDIQVSKPVYTEIKILFAATFSNQYSFQFLPAIFHPPAV
jgi:hypothetical protein